MASPTGLRARADSVRVRTTAAAVIVVGLALLLAGVALVVLLRRSLTDDVRTAIRIRADAIASTLPDRSAISAGDPEEEFVQLLGPDGRVVAASPNLAGRPAVARPSPGQERRIDGLPFEDGPFLALASTVSDGGEPLVLVVGRSLESAVEPTQVVIGLVAAGIPLLLLIVGAVTWRVVGRALSPVEAIRAEVDAISSDRLHRRVPEPGAGDEISRLATTMNRMLERLEGARARQQRFVSDASHELRSPIAAIRQHAEVARAHPDATSLDELAGVVLEEDSRLQRIVEDLLLLAAMDEGTLAVRTEPVDLDDVVLAEVARLRGVGDRPAIDGTGISAGRVAGDPGHLQRLVRNLADNAARHARGGVALSLRRVDGEVVLTVDDDGEGIPPDDRDRVFDRFVRLETARDRDSGGSGLGLAIVREIALAHHARVGVSEAPLGGARFEVRFPALED